MKIEEIKSIRGDEEIWEEKMNKSQRRRRKKSDESSAIFEDKYKNYENIVRLHELLLFVTHVVNICYIYEN